MGAFFLLNLGMTQVHGGVAKGDTKERIRRNPKEWSIDGSDGILRRPTTPALPCPLVQGIFLLGFWAQKSVFKPR